MGSAYWSRSRQQPAKTVDDGFEDTPSSDHDALAFDTMGETPSDIVIARRAELVAAATVAESTRLAAESAAAQAATDAEEATRAQALAAATRDNTRALYNSLRALMANGASDQAVSLVWSEYQAASDAARRVSDESERLLKVAAVSMRVARNIAVSSRAAAVVMDAARKQLEAAADLALQDRFEIEVIEVSAVDEVDAPVRRYVI
jgi:hypothetical protein